MRDQLPHVLADMNKDLQIHADHGCTCSQDSGQSECEGVTYPAMVSEAAFKVERYSNYKEIILAPIRTASKLSVLAQTIPDTLYP